MNEAEYLVKLLHTQRENAMLNFTDALTLKGHNVTFTYKNEQRNVFVQMVEQCKNGKQVVKGIDNTAFKAALNDPNCEVGSDAEFTRTFRLNEMFNVAVV